MAKTLSAFMEHYGYIDRWRFLHSSARQYSFFSHVHCSFSCIDCFIIESFLLAIVSTQYDLITASDHANVILDLLFDLKPKCFRFWRLDPLLLSDADFCEHISESIKVFCKTNQNGDTSASLLWETLKACIRGKIISYIAHTNKLCRARQKDQENRIANLDN